MDTMTIKLFPQELLPTIIFITDNYTWLTEKQTMHMCFSDKGRQSVLKRVNMQIRMAEYVWLKGWIYWQD